MLPVNGLSKRLASLSTYLFTKQSNFTLADVCVKEAETSGMLLLHIWFVTAISHQVVCCSL